MLDTLLLFMLKTLKTKYSDVFFFFSLFLLFIFRNGLNFFFKLLAWVYTGSASMFSEAIHSLADTCNQVSFFNAASVSTCNYLFKNKSKYLEYFYYPGKQ